MWMRGGSTKMFLLLMISTFILYGRENTAPHQNQKGKFNPFNIIAPEQIPLYVQSSLISGGVKDIALAMADIPVDRVIKNLHAIFSSAKDAVSHEDKLILLLAIIRNYSSSLENQEKVLSMLLTHPHLYEGAPLLFIVVKNNYQDVVPVVLAWHEREKNKGTIFPSYLNNMVFDALSYAIENNMPAQFNKLSWVGIEIPKNQANQLLWFTINEKKNPKFIALLKSLGADVNAITDGKYTPLMRAVQQKNKSLVNALLNAGAKANFVADPATGSALQMAIGFGYRDIEMLLRRHEGHEPLPESF